MEPQRLTLSIAVGQGQYQDSRSGLHIAEDCLLQAS